ncbi:hypothetical protein RchiOBHm_Chr4g0410031 [Rosa chinensis]|uniref:Secreted protein n=1 Tax=Rosa chinensis TaxID=74649 RepID=A0A2P6QV93_ROSCH|nr:hypothetical protein RchiOBHm_Chr4g0410031 [Rosa chinensis]
MQGQTAFNLLLWTSLTFASLLCHGWGEKCTTNDHAPTEQQSQIDSLPVKSDHFFVFMTVVPSGKARTSLILSYLTPTSLALPFFFCNC